MLLFVPKNKFFLIYFFAIILKSNFTVETFNSYIVMYKIYFNFFYEA